MNTTVLVVQLLNFAFFATQPWTVLGRGGKLNARWWLAVAPFLLWPAVLIYAAVSPVPSLRPNGWSGWLDPASVILGVASIALIAGTIATHQVPISLWHQDDDAPEHLVTHGTYGMIRHPLYTSNILAFLSLVAFYPHWVTLALAGYVIAAMTVTARREERRLAASEFGGQYRDYMARTGRFLPRLTARTSVAGAAGLSFRRRT